MKKYLALAAAFSITLCFERTYFDANAAVNLISLRKFPYPYEAMLAIDSDVDHTDLRKFNEIHTFLNTYAHTPMGVGLGLDISDSFFSYNGSNIKTQIDVGGVPLKDEMTMFVRTTTKPSQYAPILLHYIRHGWIDTFHSAGDFSTISSTNTQFTRALEVNAMNFLKKEGVKPILDFSDHGNQANVANFGDYRPGFMSYQQGDNPSSPYYIADLLRKEGVKFVWADNIYDVFSNKTMLYPLHLRDGHTMWGYNRYTGDGLTNAYYLWNPYQLYLEISPSHLENLIQTHGYAIVATHLEGNADQQVLPDSAIKALIHLAHLQKQGKILVARTSRLLKYNLDQQFVKFNVFKSKNGVSNINVQSIADPVDGTFVPKWYQVRGLTWNVPKPKNGTIFINYKAVPENEIVRSLHTIGIRWYPKNTTNWAMNVGSKSYIAAEAKMKKMWIKK